ncbi:MAG: hypothetical protein K6G22_08795 [Lachnospiraceae bacterium]|nr:hypothetical protein [Lachnospiraceae bacterium]
MHKTGVYVAKKKDGSLYYRCSLTYRGRHISLGSFDTEKEAAMVYEKGKEVLSKDLTVNDHDDFLPLPFHKFIVLINFKDNNVYIKNPIYLMNTYIEYFLEPDIIFKFDIDDLFYYSGHAIQKRGGHFFVSDYGMQVNLHSRYGIRRHAVCGRDYRFINGDRYDYRYQNIEIINCYNGVTLRKKDGRMVFRADILINGKVKVGEYASMPEAAVAYNKACDVIMQKLPDKKYELNYIEELSPSEYADLYTKIEISRFISEY